MQCGDFAYHTHTVGSCFLFFVFSFSPSNHQVTEEGHSVLAHVHGFEPYFYVECPEAEKSVPLLLFQCFFGSFVLCSSCAGRNCKHLMDSMPSDKP